MTFVAEEPSKVPLSVQAVGHSEVMQFTNRGPNVFMRFRPNATQMGMVIGSSNNTLVLGSTMSISQG